MRFRSKGGVPPELQVIYRTLYYTLVPLVSLVSPACFLSIDITFYLHQSRDKGINWDAGYINNDND
jgi:hypothetical protein